MKKQIYIIEGMTCSACQIHVEKAISNIEGVEHVSVNLLTQKAEVSGDFISEDLVVSAVKGAGYDASIEETNEKVEEVFDVTGMTCSACANHVERALKSIDGVESVTVNLLMNQAHLKYDPEKVRFLDIKKSVEEAGYKIERAVQNKNDLDENTPNPYRNMILGLIIAASMLYLTMGQMFSIKLPIPDSLNVDKNPLKFVLMQWVLTTPIIIMNLKIFTRGLKMLWKRKPNMDSLVALGTASAIIYSLYGTLQVFSGLHHYAHHLYLESAVVILALIRFGKTIEEQSKHKTIAAINALLNLKPNTAFLMIEDKIEEIDTDDIRKGDRLLIKPGMSISMDGIIESGNSSVDESMITGESIPVEKQVGDEVLMGTLNVQGSLIIRAISDNNGTKLAQIIKLVERAQMDKAPIAKIADKVSGIFVPVVIVLALISGIFWLIYDKNIEQALTVFVTVLVIACPCALGLATPTAIMVGTGIGAKNGIFVKSASSLEEASHIESVVFDKTGTLTNGQPILTDTIVFDSDEKSILQLVASLEQHSQHPLASAIVEGALDRGIKLIEPASFGSKTGVGVKGIVNGKHIEIGNERILNSMMNRYSETIESLEILSKQGKTAMIVLIDNQIASIIAVADTVRNDAKETIKTLIKMGIEPIMITGDHPKTAQAIADEVGIKKVYAQVLPEGKAEIISDLQKNSKVMMVGDGINDAIALVQSDVGVAIGSGTDVAVESAKIVLMSHKLELIVGSLVLSRETLKNIKQNLFWAFAYNVVGIPFAMGIFKLLFDGPFLNPMIAGAAMAFSSVSVVLNALSLKRKVKI